LAPARHDGTGLRLERSCEVIDPKYDELVAELRASRPAAPAELRARVGALGAPEAVPPRARRWSWWRGGLVLVPAGVAAVAAAVVIGVVDSGNGTKQQGAATQDSAAPAPLVARARSTPEKAPPAVASGRLGQEPPSAPAPPPAPAASSGRTQLYAADLTVRVKDVSAATKRALSLTRSFGGYVRSVDYGKGTASGRAYLVLRVPVGSVQEAIVRFSALGKIVDQHIAIQDIQPSIDARFRRLQALRIGIAKLQQQLAGSGLTEAQRSTLNARLVRTRSELTAVQRKQAQARKRASFATVSLGLRTKAAQVVPPAKPSRLDRTLDRIGDVLLVELEILLYVLAIALPLAAIVGLVVWGRRAGRRRAEERLLAR
jgi:hypothetical protein